MNDFDLGWLTAMIDTDAGIYFESRGDGRRSRVILDFEVGCERRATRLATLIGAEVRRRDRGARPDRIGWNPITYRVRQRGEKAIEILETCLPHLEGKTHDRILMIFSQAR